MGPVAKTAASLILALLLGGCTAVGVATTVVGVGVGVGTGIAETGVRVGVGTTMRVADIVTPDGEDCSEEESDDPEDRDDLCEGED